MGAVDDLVLAQDSIGAQAADAGDDSIVQVQATGGLQVMLRCSYRTRYANGLQVMTRCYRWAAGDSVLVKDSIGASHWTR